MRSNIFQDRTSPAWSDIWIWIAIFIGIAVRFDYLLASNWQLDSDEAIVGLMAKHVADGEPLPVFYYGQHYMGSLEPFLVSLYYRLFGFGIFGLKIVPLIFAVGLIPLAYLIAKELYGKQAGRIAALLMAFPPSALIVWSTKARGGFAEVLFIAALALWLQLREMKSQDRSLLSQTAIWSLLGFGWWVNNQIIFFLVPFAIVAGLSMLRDMLDGAFKDAIARGGVITLAFAVGGMFFWIYNAANDFITFQTLGGVHSDTTVESHIQGLFSQALPIIMGGKRLWETTDVFPAATAIVYSLYGIVIFLYLAANLRASFWGKLLLPLILVSTATIFTLSSFGHLVEAPRYLLPLYVPLIPMTAIALSELSRVSKIVAYGFTVTFLAVNTASHYWNGRGVMKEPFVYKQTRVSVDHKGLIDFLEQHQIKEVRTNYWIGYRLAFETNEEVTFRMFREPYQVRIPSYEDRFDVDSALVPLVLVPSQVAEARRGLKALGYTFDEALVSNYHVLFNIKRSFSYGEPLAPETFSVTASHNQIMVKGLYDGDESTRWGSAHPQMPSMYLKVSFEKPTVVAGLRYEVGEWRFDYPRRLRITALGEDGVIREILSPRRYEAISFVADRNMLLSFPPIRVKELRFEQEGSDPIFDWSIAELEILGPAKPK
jgi:hypothetical protein